MVVWINKKQGLCFPERFYAVLDIHEYALMHSRTLHLNMNPKCFVKRNFYWQGVSGPWILFSVFACWCNVLFPFSSLQRCPGLHLKIVGSSRTWQVEKKLDTVWITTKLFFYQLRPLYRSQQRWGLIADMFLRLTFFIPFRIQLLSK